MADAKDIALQIAENNELFLANSYERKIVANTPNGTTFKIGDVLKYTAPIIPGWAATARVFYNLTPNVTLNGGTVVASQAAPYNVFQRVKVEYGGSERRNHHGYFLKLLQQTDEHDGTSPRYGGPDTEGYASKVFSTTPVAGGANTWKGFMDIDLQFSDTSTVGLLPMGASASPVTITLEPCSAFLGTDPFLNPIVQLTGNSTVSVTGTVTVVITYRYGQSPHNPSIQVPTPHIGYFAKMVQFETPITSTASVTFAELREPYEHLYVFQVPVIAGQTDGTFCNFDNIVGAKFMLDPSNPMLDYTTQGGTIDSLWADQRVRYGQDLDAGVVVWDFISGSDPKKPDGVNTVNIGAYNAAQAGIQYNGTLAANSNRIVTCVMYLEELPF